MSSPFVIASKVSVRPVEWLWRPFVPLGKITCFAGRMGQGKTLLSTHLAARVTRGELTGKPAGVVMLSAEDDNGDTMAPRLIAAGADLDLVALMSTSQLDLDHIEAARERVGAVLVTLDPFASFVPAGMNAYRSQDVRALLDPLREWAQAHRVAVLVIQHINRQSESTDALDRIADSQGLPQVARSVLVWGADPQDEHGDGGRRKVLTRAKTNLVPSSEGMAQAFEITSRPVPGAGSQPVLVDHGVTTTHADDVVQSSQARSSVEEARRFLVEHLADGPQPAKDVEREADEAGLPAYALRKARERYVRSYRPGKTTGPYVWELIA